MLWAEMPGPFPSSAEGGAARLWDFCSPRVGMLRPPLAGVASLCRAMAGVVPHQMLLL